MRGRVAVEDLQVDGGEVVVGIRVELALEFCQRLGIDLLAGGIEIELVAGPRCA
jgi:hypothetical protein